MPDLISPKDPAEIVFVGIDFTAVLGSETMSTIAWTCSINDGPVDDPAAAAMLVGSPINTDAPIFKHRVQAGVDGVRYKLRCVLTTSGARTLVGVAVLPVRTA